MEITIMSKIRLAQKDETAQQKEIWKRCFGDPDSYIDFYYSNRYKEDETLLLLHDDEISAMLTRISVRTVIPDGQSFATVMLYAIATHPKYQNQGFASQLINFSDQHLGAKKNELSILVPAQKQLFNYYRKQGFQDAFYVQESLLSSEQIEALSISRSNSCTISAATPAEYNFRRDKQLKGSFYISYAEEDIAYQKKLSQQSGADIYAVDTENIQGCLTVERITAEKIFIKELLLPEDCIFDALKKVAQCLPAKEYFLRTPGCFKISEQLGGSIRSFGMIKFPRDIDLIRQDERGYLGLAFD